jgi:hypothetical protein
MMVDYKVSEEHKATEETRLATTDADAENRVLEVMHQTDEQRQQLQVQARSAHRAYQGWGQIRTAEDWERAVVAAKEDYRDGTFLLKRLGAGRFLDPELHTVLLGLRQGLLEDLGASVTHADLMLIDMAILDYYNALRVQNLIGDAALKLEHEYFGTDGPNVTLRRTHGREVAAKLDAEAAFRRLSEQLQPLKERSNRMLLRNLQALQDRRSAPAPSVQIENAGQVNVANQQVSASAATPAQIQKARASSHRLRRRDARTLKSP